MRQHAWGIVIDAGHGPQVRENLAALLEVRDEELDPPTLMCDGLDSRDLPAVTTSARTSSSTKLEA